MDKSIYIIEASSNGTHRLKKRNTTKDVKNYEIGTKLKKCTCNDDNLKLSMIKLNQKKIDKIDKEKKRKQSFEPVDQNEFYNSKCFHHNCIIS